MVLSTPPGGGRILRESFFWFKDGLPGILWCVLKASKETVAKTQKLKCIIVPGIYELRMNNPLLCSRHWWCPFQGRAFRHTKPIFRGFRDFIGYELLVICPMVKSRVLLGMIIPPLVGILIMGPCKPLRTWVDEFIPYEKWKCHGSWSTRKSTYREGIYLKKHTIDLQPNPGRQYEIPHLEVERILRIRG